MQSEQRNVLLSIALGALLLVGAGCAQPTTPGDDARPTGGAPVNGGAESIKAEDKNEAAEVGKGEEATETEAEEAAESDDAKKSDAGSSAGSATTPSGEVKVFKIVASNFEFEPSEIRVKMGDKVRFEVTSADNGAGSGHGIAIPAFNVNVKVDVNKPGVAEFVADKKGSFPFFCNVFCGNGHREMKGTLIVE